MAISHRAIRQRVMGHRRAATIAAALAGSLLVTGCGGSGGAAGGPGVAGPGPRPTESVSTGAPATAGSTSGSGGDDAGFGWVPFGPADPGDPPPNQWYGALEKQDCTNLHAALAADTDDHLWLALDAVCAAAFNGDQSQWALAATEAAAAAADGAGPGTTGCLGDAAKALLARALAWHAAHPDARPVVTVAKPGQPTACPFRITSITLVDADNNAVPGPLRGPIAGGTRLAIRGQGLGNSPTVLIAGHPATILGSEGSGGAIFVATPAVSHPLVARVRVGNQAGQLLAKVDFHYVASGS